MTKRIIAFLSVAILICSVFQLSVLAESSSSKEAMDNADKERLFSSKLYCYNEDSYFNGTKVTADFDLEDYCILSLDDYGGTHMSEGDKVYSNYVTISLDFQYEASHTLSGGAKIVSTKEDRIHGKWVGKTGTHGLDTDIGYGTIVVSRERQSGGREIYKYIHFNADSRDLSQLSFTEDGNYHVAIFFEASKGGVRKKYVAEYVIPIRSSIYVTDMSSEFHIKDTGFYYEDVKLNFAGRKNIDVYVNGQYAVDGYVLKKPDTGKVEYDISVHSSGFVSERFTVTLYHSNEDHFFVYGSNLRRKVGENVYEAENHFKLIWSDISAEIIPYYSKDGEDEQIYTRNTVIDEDGTYVFRFHSEKLKLNSYYVVFLYEDSAPSYNYGVLSANRFNNFITKWYEVYDADSDLYYCFHIGEYNEAYNAALSMEKKKVLTYGSGYMYNDVFYDDISLLTEKMNESVKEKITVTYYDVDNSTEKKYFSDNLFDGTVYINPDFEFVKNHPSETNSVIMIDENGTEYPIDFFTKISQYELSDGKYRIVEADLYGNTTEYVGIIDSSAPRLKLNLTEAITEIENEKIYQAKYFSIDSLFDKHDSYAVISVNNTDFYLSKEYENKIYFTSGNYFIKAYDRNGNVVRCVINIPNKENYYTLSTQDGFAELSLNEKYKIEKVFVDSQEQDISDLRALKIRSGDNPVNVTVYVTGGEEEKDCISFTVPEEKAPNNANGSNQESENEFNLGIWINSHLWWIVLGIVALSAIIGLPMIFVKRKGA